MANVWLCLALRVSIPLRMFLNVYTFVFLNRPFGGFFSQSFFLSPNRSVCLFACVCQCFLPTMYQCFLSKDTWAGCCVCSLIFRSEILLPELFKITPDNNNKTFHNSTIYFKAMDFVNNTKNTNAMNWAIFQNKLSFLRI